MCFPFLSLKTPVEIGETSQASIIACPEGLVQQWPIICQHPHEVQSIVCVLAIVGCHKRVADVASWWKCRSLQQDEMMPLRPGDRILLGTAPDDATRLGDMACVLTRRKIRIAWQILRIMCWKHLKTWTFHVLVNFGVDDLGCPPSQ